MTAATLTALPLEHCKFERFGTAILPVEDMTPHSDIDAKLKLKKTGSQGQEGGDAKPKPKPTVNTLLMSPRANDMLNQAARAGGRAAAAGAGAGTGMVTPKGKGTGKAAGARTPLSPLASNTPRRAGSREEPAWKVAARDVLSPSLTQPSWKY